MQANPAPQANCEMETCAPEARSGDASGEHNAIYAVVTTGIYCLPSCPSRRPRPENVRFFGTPEAARAAGFRACKRCNPDGIAASADEKAAAISGACQLIADAEPPVDFGAIAAAVSMSRHHFHRVFKAAMGMTPGAYLRATRERAVLSGLSSGSTVTEAIYAAGYGSSSRFYETVAPKLGLKAGAFFHGGAGQTIRFAVGECSLGAVLVAATPQGICALEFGDDAGVLLQDFQRRFSAAELSGRDPDFERLVAEVVGFAENPGAGLDIPLAVSGTAFQHKVWQALRDIPAGTTLTYAQVAARIGHPKAVRAVASACARNKVAVAIPCHRVVRTGGALSGFRWGIERKAQLIAKESSREGQKTPAITPARRT